MFTFCVRMSCCFIYLLACLLTYLNRLVRPLSLQLAMINVAIMATNLFFDWKIAVFQGEVVGNVPLRCFSFSVMLHVCDFGWIRLQWLLNKKNNKNHGQKQNIGNHLINSTTWQAKDGMVGVRDRTGSPGHGSPGQQFGSGSGRVTGQSSDPDFDPGSCSMQWKIVSEV